MKIIVLVKEVPDTYGERKLDPATGRLDRGASEAIIDEIGERALEVALSYQDSNPAEIVALTLGPASASDILRKALAMGADSAVHVVDDGLAGADLVLTAEALAAAIKAEGFDLVITGNESTDGRGGVMGALLAEKLGLPYIGYLNSTEISASGVRGVRGTEGGTEEVSAPLPAIVSVTERSPDPRFASFRGIMKAKKKPLKTETLASLGVSAPGSASVVKSVSSRPPRTAGVKIQDDGTAAAQLVDFLAAQRLI